MAAPALYPSASATALKLQYIGKHLRDLPAPAAVLDVAVIKRNCKAMLDTCKALDLNFRAHVKTHKTTEVTRHQMGEDSQDVRLIASTISEVENLTPYLLESKAKGATVNILYGLPIARSHVARLAAVARLVGEGSIGLFVDHPDQLRHLATLEDKDWPGTIPVMVKIVAELPPRAGLDPESKLLAEIAQMIESSPKISLKGAYAHLGHSYGSSSPTEALEFLMKELKAVQAGANAVVANMKSRPAKLTISLGATPTATAAQNALADTEWNQKFKSYMTSVQQDYDVELHAGVYPVLDMQQLATRARPLKTEDDGPLLDFDNLGFRIMAEVVSVYNEREKPEALIGAGGIVLGREPCKSYPGWAVMTPWRDDGGASTGPFYNPEGSRTGWIVGRISQEHGNLVWEQGEEQQTEIRQLRYGEKVMLWPNHACMAGPAFGWYFVVDSSSEEPDKVKDIWVRWRGW